MVAAVKFPSGPVRTKKTNKHENETLCGWTEATVKDIRFIYAMRLLAGYLFTAKSRMDVFELIAAVVTRKEKNVYGGSITQI